MCIGFVKYAEQALVVDVGEGFLKEHAGFDPKCIQGGDSSTPARNLNNINPQKWVAYVIENIADYKVNKLHELLPNNIVPEKLENFKRFWAV